MGKIIVFSDTSHYVKSVPNFDLYPVGYDSIYPVNGKLQLSNGVNHFAKFVLKLNSILVILMLMLCHSSLNAQEPDLGTEAQREAGRKLYMEKCTQCHGKDGGGNGIAKPFFKPAPRDFTTATFKIRSTASGELPTDEDLKRVIKEGMPYTGMPAWPNLTEKGLSNLVYHLKTYSDFFSGPYGVVEPIDIPDPPSYSEESAQKGRQVYEANQCFDCHGQFGRGDGKSAPTLEDQWGEHIRPADLSKRWTFRGGTSRKDIYRTFTTGMDGTPMPSYNIESEKRWQLVDYVYSLSRDEPDYATMVVAKPVAGELDIEQGKSFFATADSALFPVVGQVIEPGREFYPGVNAIEVKAVYNQEDIAVLLTWHTMSAETSGVNAPDLEVPGFASQIKERVREDTTSYQYSDAVAMQIPIEMPEGPEKPYFLFGDGKNPVDLWFVDLANPEAKQYLGRGSQNIQLTEDPGLAVHTEYQHGEWSVIFKRSLESEQSLSFMPGNFVPVAFSVWDGFNRERGNKRGITAWYHLYLEPVETESAALPMATYAGLTLFIELLIIFGVRRRHRKGRSNVSQSS